MQEQDDSMNPGDLTSRLLSALIEEKIIRVGDKSVHLSTSNSFGIMGGHALKDSGNGYYSAKSPRSPSHPLGSSTPDSKSRDKEAAGRGRGKKSLEWTDVPAVPLTTSPVMDYSQSAYLDLEQRIKLELRAIGLLDDDDIDPRTREDDEICAELRALRARLKDQVHVNNQFKARLTQLAMQKMNEHGGWAQQLANDREIEKQYRLVMKSRKKRKKGT